VNGHPTNSSSNSNHIPLATLHQNDGNAAVATATSKRKCMNFCSYDRIEDHHKRRKDAEETDESSNADEIIDSDDTQLRHYTKHRTESSAIQNLPLQKETVSLVKSLEARSQAQDREIEWLKEHPGGNNEVSGIVSLLSYEGVAANFCSFEFHSSCSPVHRPLARLPLLTQPRPAQAPTNKKWIATTLLVIIPCLGRTGKTGATACCVYPARGLSAAIPIATPCAVTFIATKHGKVALCHVSRNIART
jgi:hypothetical protein